MAGADCNIYSMVSIVSPLEQDGFDCWLSAARAEVEDRMEGALSMPGFSGLKGALKEAGSLFDFQALEALRGGKRLRALLEMAASLSAGGRGGSEAACAIEIFQAGALVHDDIVDKSEMRRGKPSSRKAFLSSLPSPALGADCADAMAIMLGDFLASASVEALLEAEFGKNAAFAIRAFCRMQMQVEKGQVLDIASPSLPFCDPEALEDGIEKIYLYKTASYTTVAPISLGFLEAGIEPAEAQKWGSAVGDPLGVAFQIADDLTDLEGGSKPKGADIREKKRTFLLADSLSLLPPKEREELADLYREGETKGKEEEIISAFRRCGAVEKSHERIRSLWKRAVTSLQECSGRLGIGEDGMDFLGRAMALFIPDADCRALTPEFL